MTWFNTDSGGMVFAVGSITYAAALPCDPHISRVTANVIDHMLE